MLLYDLEVLVFLLCSSELETLPVLANNAEAAEIIGV